MEVRVFIDWIARQVGRLPRPVPASFIRYLGSEAQQREYFLYVMGWSEQYLRPARIRDQLKVAKAIALIAHLVEGLQEAGQANAELPNPNWDDSILTTENGLAIKEAWLDYIAHAFADAVDKLLVQPEERQNHMSWRRIPRPELVRLAQQKLKEQNRTAIVGMSGTGKSFLARQVYERFADGPKVWFEAPKLQNGYLLESDLITLGVELFRFLSDHLQSGLKSDDRKVNEFRMHLLDLWAILARLDRIAGVQKFTDILEQNILTSPSQNWGADLLPYVERVNSPVGIRAALKAIIPLLCTGSRDKPLIYLIVLDDVWQAERIEHLIEALAPIKSLSSKDLRGAGWPVRLLITSQYRLSVFGGKHDDRNQFHDLAVELDQDETQKQEFALNVLAAWSVPNMDNMTPSEALLVMADWRISAIDLPPLLEDIRKALEYTGWHPLTAAALGSLWRVSGEDTIFAELLALFSSSSNVDLDFDDANGLMAKDVGINDRHSRVVQALLHITHRALKPADRERFLDLAIQRRGSGAINDVLLDYFWRRQERSGQTTRSRQRNLISRVFADLMLVQRDRGQYKLHDIFRLAIAVELRERGESIAQRHRDLLETAGLLDENGKLLLDQVKDFLQEEGNPDVVMSDRWRMHLRLRPDSAGSVQVETRKELSRFFLDELIHHVRVLDQSNGSTDLELSLLTNLAFLQAQLDWDS